MELYTGEELKLLYPDKKFYKITNETEKHYGHQYVTGINKNSQKLTSSSCSNGLYFTDYENLDM